MKAVVIRAFGPPEGLQVVETDEPEPVAGQVLVSVEAVGVGGVDAVIRSGLLGNRGFDTGFIPGGEIAGTVSAVASDVDPSWVGRRVWGFTGVGGGYVERAVLPVDGLVPIPDQLSAADSVTLGTSGSVAHHALGHAHFRDGESVLVRGAGGGIGVMAVQLAARAGAGAVAVTTSSPARGARLLELGATHLLDRTGAGDQDAPTGYDVMLDIVAGPDLPRFFDRLNSNGRLVVLGVVGGYPPADFGMALFAAFQRSLSFATFSADTVPESDRRAVIAGLFEAAARGELRSVVQERLPLAEAVRAHRMLSDGEVFGRIVLEP